MGSRTDPALSAEKVYTGSRASITRQRMAGNRKDKCTEQRLVTTRRLLGYTCDASSFRGFQAQHLQTICQIGYQQFSQIPLQLGVPQLGSLAVILKLV